MSSKRRACILVGIGFVLLVLAYFLPFPWASRRHSTRFVTMKSLSGVDLDGFFVGLPGQSTL